MKFSIYLNRRVFVMRVIPYVDKSMKCISSYPPIIYSENRVMQAYTLIKAISLFQFLNLTSVCSVISIKLILHINVLTLSAANFTLNLSSALFLLTIWIEKKLICKVEKTEFQTA